jgi:hypothetical protein
MGMGMGVNPYPPVYMGDPMGLFLCHGYGYGVVIPGGYLPIAISNLVILFHGYLYLTTFANMWLIVEGEGHILDIGQGRVAVTSSI